MSVLLLTGSLTLSIAFILACRILKIIFRDLDARFCWTNVKPRVDNDACHREVNPETKHKKDPTKNSTTAKNITMDGVCHAHYVGLTVQKGPHLSRNYHRNNQVNKRLQGNRFSPLHYLGAGEDVFMQMT